MGNLFPTRTLPSIPVLFSTLPLMREDLEGARAEAVGENLGPNAALLVGEFMDW